MRGFSPCGVAAQNHPGVIPSTAQIKVLSTHRRSSDTHLALARAPQRLASASWVCGCGLRVWASECFRCGSERRVVAEAPSLAKDASASLLHEGQTKKTSTEIAVTVLRQFILDVDEGKLTHEFPPDLSAQDKLKLVSQTFLKVHPKYAQEIKRAGGLKLVAQDFSHLISYGEKGVGILSAPPASEQARLKQLQRKPIMLADVFIDAGGEVLSFDRFNSIFGEGNKPAAVSLKSWLICQLCLRYNFSLHMWAYTFSFA